MFMIALLIIDWVLGAILLLRTRVYLRRYTRRAEQFPALKLDREFTLGCFTQFCMLVIIAALTVTPFAIVLIKH